MQLARILDEHDAVAGLGDFCEDRVDQRRLAGARPAGDQHVLSVAHGRAEQLGLVGRHDAGLDVVAERVNGDGRPPDGKARRSHHGRHQALEPLPAFRQFRRDARAAGMHFDPDMVRDQAHDALGVRGRDATAGVFKTA